MEPQNNPNPDQFAQALERLGSANNVLVTVSNNPSVDQLAACIALTIALNKQNKHGTAVFSGEPPSTIEFLKPADTLEKNTDSLRDFIISLDKAKADKLRYKVENDVVKIFITPYRTSISEKDFDFSQGDFNVEAVVALGVHDRADLDATIVAHGRILHDATVISINTAPGSELGSINWLDTGSSSLCEMTSDLISGLGKDLLDAQIATALLTGIVAETDRFRNEKSNPHTMSVSGVLMAAGASTQLVASKLEAPVVPSTEIPAVVDGEVEPNDDGMIEIDHAQETQENLEPQEPADDIHIDGSGRYLRVEDIEREKQEKEEEEARLATEESEESENERPDTPSIMTQPPQLGGQLTANSVPEYQQYGSSTDPLSAPQSNSPILTRTQLPDEPTPPVEMTVPVGGQTLSDIERAVNSPHTEQSTDIATAYMPPEPDPPVVLDTPEPTVAPAVPDEARDAVQRAVEAVAQYQPEPIEALGATPVALDLDHPDQAVVEPTDNIVSPTETSTDETPPPTTTPPPVPPPIAV